LLQLELKSRRSFERQGEGNVLVELAVRVFLAVGLKEAFDPLNRIKMFGRDPLANLAAERGVRRR